MRYRTLGRTGLKVGEIGLGTEYLNGPSRETVGAVVAEAVEAGVNYFDVLYSFPEYLDNLGAALRGRRDQVVLTVHLGCAETDGQYRRSRDPEECDRNFHDMLRRLGTDRADIIIVQNSDEQSDYEEILRPGGLLELALRLRGEGKGRFLGLSSHTVPVPQRAVESGVYDVLMFSINAAFDALPSEAGSWGETGEKRDLNLARRSLYQLCAHREVGLVAMKPFGGGRLLAPGDGLTAPSPVECLSYVLSQPGVCTTVPGVKSVEELRASLHYCEATPEARDYSALVARSQSNLAKVCVYCNHCQPCPQEIDIGQAMRLLDLASLGLTEQLRRQYRTLPGGSPADCVECGACQGRCPFGFDAGACMKRAAEVFAGE